MGVTNCTCLHVSGWILTCDSCDYLQNTCAYRFGNGWAFVWESYDEA